MRMSRQRLGSSTAHEFARIARGKDRRPPQPFVRVPRYVAALGISTLHDSLGYYSPSRSLMVNDGGVNVARSFASLPLTADFDAFTVVLLVRCLSEAMLQNLTRGCVSRRVPQVWDTTLLQFLSIQ